MHTFTQTYSFTKIILIGMVLNSSGHTRCQLPYMKWRIWWSNFTPRWALRIYLQIIIRIIPTIPPLPTMRMSCLKTQKKILILGHTNSLGVCLAVVTIAHLHKNHWDWHLLLSRWPSLTRNRWSIFGLEVWLIAGGRTDQGCIHFYIN